VSKVLWSWREDQPNVFLAGAVDNVVFWMNTYWVLPSSHYEAMGVLRLLSTIESAGVWIAAEEAELRRRPPDDEDDGPSLERIHIDHAHSIQFYCWYLLAKKRKTLRLIESEDGDGTARGGAGVAGAAAAEAG
jgi:hypothetical protein